MADPQGLSSPRQKKHIPIIDAPKKIKEGELFHLRITVNKDIQEAKTGHPGRFWLNVYFLPQEKHASYQVVRPLFTAQKELGKEPDSPKNPVLYRESFRFRAEKSGSIYAASYCPKHGLSQSETRVKVIPSG